MQTRLELYRLVAPLAGLGIWERNLVTGAVYWNKIVRQIFEVPDEYIPGPGIAFHFYKDPAIIEDLINEVKRTEQPTCVKAAVITAKGTHKWVKVRMQVKKEDSVNVLLYGTLEDITEEVAFHQLLEEREQRFSHAFNDAPIGMALVALNGAWLKVNRSICTLLGYTEQELLQLTFQQLTYADDLGLDLLQMHRLIAGKSDTYSIEKRYFHKDGHIIWALLNVSVIRDDTGDPLYFVSQVKDITERKKSMEVIRAQNERLLNFAHIVSHNLRSHAGNIRMLTDMARDERHAKDHEELLELLSNNADSLLTTLEELNEVVTIHDCGLTHRESLNLKKAIERVAGILSASVIQAGVVLRIDVPGDLMVLYNPSYLESVFMNLFTNSIKYRHPDRRPCITVTTVNTQDRIVVKIADNGIGIDLKLHGHKLFGMYKTFHNNADARGMGLFLIKNQVEAMGGCISAESAPGEGATFVLEINKN